MLELLFFFIANASPAIAGDASGRPMLEIPAGSYQPLYRANPKEDLITKIPVAAFLLDQHPVTREDFLKFVTKNKQWRRSSVKKIFADSSYLRDWPSDLDIDDQQPSDSPVRYVSWFAARAFCDDESKRLPSTAEWERAAAAFPEEANIQKLILSWYAKPNRKQWPSVGKGPKNEFGVFDLHGLIWEWVEDFNSNLVTGESRADSSLDQDQFCGAGALNASQKENYPAFMRYGFRNSLKAKYTTANLGFRCARSK